MYAFTVIEQYSGEYPGTVIFAKSSIEAKRLASSELDCDGIAGMRTQRAPYLDSYKAANAVPIDILVWNGWNFECYNCGVRIEEDLYDPDNFEETGMQLEDNPQGTLHGPCYCSEACQTRARIRKQRKDEVAFNEFARLRGIVYSAIKDPIFYEGPESHKQHIYVTFSDGKPVIEEARISFTVPGARSWGTCSTRKNAIIDSISLPFVEDYRKEFDNFLKKGFDKYR